MDRLWHIKGKVFAILDTRTGKYISRSTNNKFFAEEVMIFNTPKSASEYIENYGKYGLNKNIFKVTEI